MNPRSRLLSAGLICIVIWCGMSAAFAKNVTVADARLIKRVVQSQLQALAADDAITAFSLSTSGARSELGSPQNLLQMVKDQYDPMRHYRLAIFLVPERATEGASQTVRITDRDNKVWLVEYEMQRETDGSWKINGWQLMETDTISV